MPMMSILLVIDSWLCLATVAFFFFYTVVFLDQTLNLKKDREGN